MNEKIGNDFSVLVGAACANMNMLLKMHKYPGRRTGTHPICETTIKLLILRYSISNIIWSHCEYTMTPYDVCYTV